MSTMTSSPTAEDLLSLPEDVFRRIVDADLRGKGDPETAVLLRSEKVVDRWYATIVGMAKSVEGQLAAKKADLEATVLDLECRITKARTPTEAALLTQEMKEMQRKEAKWRAGILRFKTGLEEVHSEARRIRDSYKGSFFESYLAEERNHALGRVRELEMAIRAHRDHVCEEDRLGCNDNDCNADIALWSTVS